ncbi:lipoprotein [Salinispora arenicola]|uniref:lipoprotein n=1 Tax=Salinispora arenicola TaxID=168697 RepID=UPI000366B6EA|nr:lipoprotein [Salinispora arenicola]
MRVVLRRRLPAALAVLAFLVPAGCGTAEDSSDAGSSAGSAAVGEPWYDEITPADANGAAGGTDGPCPLPVTFPVAAGWQAEAIELPDPTAAGVDDPELAAEMTAMMVIRGDATARCEVDGRGAGGGFLRVWTTEQDVTPRAALDAFLADTSIEQATEAQFRDVTAGDLTGVEATWVSHNELLDEERRSWAVAVPANGQSLLFEVSEGLLTEHSDLLPAYRLTVQGLRTAG